MEKLEIAFIFMLLGCFYSVSHGQFVVKNGTSEYLKVDKTTGNVTISNKLTTQTLQVQDGNQAQGRVLTSDAQGNASWSSLPDQKPVAGDAIDVDNRTVSVLYDGNTIKKNTSGNLYSTAVFESPNLNQRNILIDFENESIFKVYVKDGPCDINNLTTWTDVNTSYTQASARSGLSVGIRIDGNVWQKPAGTSAVLVRLAGFTESGPDAEQAVGYIGYRQDADEVMLSEVANGGQITENGIVLLDEDGYFYLMSYYQNENADRRFDKLWVSIYGVIK
jgi:hypothetical protein